MKNRTLALCLLLVIVSSVVFATGTSETKKPEQQVTTLRFGWWGGDSRHEAYMAAAQRYMELNPNVKIISEYGGWDGYREKLYTQLAGGNAPHIFQNHFTWLEEQSGWSEKAVVKDLNQYKDYLDLTIFSEGLLEDNVVFNNKMLALPSSINADILIGNKAVLDKIGFDYNAQWSFEDFFTFSSELKKVDKSLYFENGMAASDIHMYWFLAYLVQKTGLPYATDNQLSYDEATVIEAFQFIKRYFDEGVVEPLGSLELYSGNYPQNPKWVNGKTGIMFGMLSTLENYVNAMGDYKGDAAVIRLPILTGAKDVYYQTKIGQIFSISASATEKEAIEAAKFINWMNTDKEAGILLQLSRGIPVSEEQNKALSEAGLLNPLVVQAMQYANEIGNGIGQGTLIRNNEIARIGADMISSLAFGKDSVEQVAKTYIKLVNRKLKELDSASK